MSIINNGDKKIKIRTCRICLDAKSVEMVLLDEQNGWLKLFEYCFGFSLTMQDEPRLLCKLCAENVEGYVEFKEKCKKSHILWQSVISDVKCYVIKHSNVDVDNENINKTVNDGIANKTQMTDQLFETSFDNDFIISDDDEAVNLHTEIKTENDDENIKMDYESKRNVHKLDEKDCANTNEVDSKQNKPEKSNGSVTTKEKKHKCLKCKKVYARYAWYLSHINVCQAKRRKRRKSHTKNHYDPEYAYNCGRNYDNVKIDEIKNEFQSDKCIGEIIENQNRDAQFLCGLCKLSFSSTKDMCNHLNEHWSNNELACKLCDFIGIDLAAMVAHRYSHYPRKGKKRFICHICEKSTMSLLALHFHYRLVHLKKVGGYCSRCNKEFTKLITWKKHERRHGTPWYICDICGKQFYFKYRIREHMMDHIRFNKCICDICGNFFSRPSYLKLHIQTVHTKLEPLKCTHCNRMFKSDFYLNQHLKIISREKTFKCEVCLKAFVTPNVLKSHMVMHSNERPYRCNICDASYKAKCILKVHMRKHTGFLPHKCMHCTKAFATTSQLKVHSSVHTGVRRHSCIIPNCIRTFHSKKLMLAHLALRHKTENDGQKGDI